LWLAADVSERRLGGVGGGLKRKPTRLQFLT
jgi:hypothetical protein